MAWIESATIPANGGTSAPQAIGNINAAELATYVVEKGKPLSAPAR